nr:glycosyltransferase family 25 protein [Pollutimonas bauzanensis]
MPTRPVPPKPAVHVVSLETAQDRRAFMRAQMDRMGIPFEFFDAIHGARNPDHYLFKKYNDKKRLSLRGAGASLRLPQLGCFASHYLLWEKCAQADAPIIVLEDDAILLPPFLSFYEHAAGFAEEHGLVWLQPSRKVANQAGRSIGKVGSLTVKKFAKGFAGTTGYMIAPRTARILLEYCSEWIYPVDNTMDRFYDHKIEAIGLDPVCVAQDDDFESSINIAPAGRKRSVSDSLRREWVSLKDTVNRTAHNLAFHIKFTLR